jgi:selenocysteine lyase/cysteine desulfurase
MDRLNFLRTVGLGVGAALTGRATLRDGEQSPAWPVAFRADEPETFWAAVRAQYSVDPRLTYLNSGGLGPSPRPVLDMLDFTARALQHRVETGHFFFEQARGIVAKFLGAIPDEVCFTRNATEGNSIIAAGLGLRAGDEIILETHAHPGGSLPWLNQARQAGAVIRTFVPDANSAAGNVERIAALIGPRTRVVQVSHVTAPTGILMPVAEVAGLCRERGVWFHIDGAQSFGMVPFDLRAIGCDSYAGSGHKWIGGPRESGVLFIRQEQIERVAPLHLGAYSSGDFDFSGQMVFTQGVRRHEYGTRNAASVVALAEATRFQDEIGRERLAARNALLVAQLADGLRQLPRVEILTPANPALRGAMLTFRVAGVAGAKVYQQLFDTGRLRCRPVSEEGLDAVRVSFHVFNTEEQGARLLAGIADVLKAGVQ